MKKIFKNIRKLSEFDKDLKRLSKRYKTLESDLTSFIEQQLNLTHKLGVDNNGVVEMSSLGIDYPRVYKARKFACKSLKGRGSQSGIRIIYAYFKEEDKIEFLEIYFKGDKENEDRDRILRYYGKDA